MGPNTALRPTLNSPARLKPQPAAKKGPIATWPCPWVQWGPGRRKSQSKEIRSFPLESPRDYDFWGVGRDFKDLSNPLEPENYVSSFLFICKREGEVKHRDIIHRPKKNRKRWTWNPQIPNSEVDVGKFRLKFSCEKKEILPIVNLSSFHLFTCLPVVTSWSSISHIWKSVQHIPNNSIHPTY